MSDATVKPGKDGPAREARFRRAYIKQRLLDLKTERDALIAERQALTDASKKQAQPKSPAV